MTTQKEKDHITGVETTGHEWDGLKELNMPAPRWWLLVFLVCCVWSVWYWIVYPAWPTTTDHTKGSAGWTQYKKLAEEQAEITARRGEMAQKLQSKSLDEIQSDPSLYQFAVAGGKAMFKENCAACHGTGAQGGPGYPNLNDDDWLWGGSLDAIAQTIKYGVRSGHEQTRDSAMPAFGEMLSKEQIGQVADYVDAISSGKPAAAEGTQIFADNCAACHGADAKGNRELGAPNLTDAIWLYGSGKDAVAKQVAQPRHGVMPAWEARLSEDTIKQLTIYVHSLGGGEKSSAPAATPAAETPAAQ